MATFFIDIDGTLVKHGTDEFLEGALENLKLLKESGHTIVLTTLRGDAFESESIYGKKLTLQMLRNNTVQYDQIIWNLPSPRVVINDDGAHAINHPTNGKFDYWSSIGKL